MTTIPQPDFVGRLLGEGVELAVRPLLPSIFDPVPAPDPIPEPVVRQRIQPEPEPLPRTEIAQPEQVRPTPPVPVVPRMPKPEVAQAAVPQRTIREPQASETPARMPETPPQQAETPRTEYVAPSMRTEPVVVTQTERKENPVAVPVAQQVEKTVVQQGVSTVVPVVTPIVPAATVAAPATQPQAQRPVAPRRSKAVEQTVHITIGRVEVKAAADKAPERRAAPRRQPTTSLEDYLRRRGGGTS